MGKPEPAQIDLNLLAVFDAVMTERSLTLAGKRLGMTQSAVSHALVRLREMLGDPLFERARRGVVPTARAREIADGIAGALSAFEECYRPVREFDPATSQRTFSLDLPIGLDALILPALLAMTAGYPGLSFRAFNGRATDIQHAVRPGEPLLALDYVPIKAPEYHSEMLFEDSFVVLARRRHPRISGAVSRETYASLSHIVLTWTRDTGPTPLDRALATVGITRHARMHVPLVSSMPALIAGSDLIATLPQRIARTVTKGTAIEVHPIEFEVPLLAFYMVWHASSDADPSHAWLRKAVRTAVAKL